MGNREPELLTRTLDLMDAVLAPKPRADLPAALREVHRQRIEDYEHAIDGALKRLRRLYHAGKLAENPDEDPAFIALAKVRE